MVKQGVERGATRRAGAFTGQCDACLNLLRWDWRRMLWTSIATGRAVCTGGLPGAYHVPREPRKVTP